MKGKKQVVIPQSKKLKRKQPMVIPASGAPTRNVLVLASQLNKNSAGPYRKLSSKQRRQDIPELREYLS